MACILSGITEADLPDDFDWEDRVSVEILDMQTGEIVPGYVGGEETLWSYHWWTEGNGSCDCNRELCFPGGREPNPHPGKCIGAKRYLIVKTSKGNLRHLNQYYAESLIHRYCEVET